MVEKIDIKYTFSEPEKVNIVLIDDGYKYNILKNGEYNSHVIMRGSFNEAKAHAEKIVGKLNEAINGGKKYGRSPKPKKPMRFGRGQCK